MRGGGGRRQAAKWKGRIWRRLATRLLSRTTILQPDTSSRFVNACLGFQVLSGEVARVAKLYCSIIIVTAERHNANVTQNTQYSTNPWEATAVWTLHIHAEGSAKSHQRFVEVCKLPWKGTNMVVLALLQRAFGTLNNMTNKTLGLACKEKTQHVWRLSAGLNTSWKPLKQWMRSCTWMDAHMSFQKGGYSYVGVVRQEAGLLLKLLKPVSM